MNLVVYAILCFSLFREMDITQGEQTEDGNLYIITKEKDFYSISFQDKFKEKFVSREKVNIGC